MEKTLKVLDVIAQTVLVIFVLFIVFCFGIEAQRMLLGVSTLEKRVMVLEIEADQKAGLYKENE